MQSGSSWTQWAILAKRTLGQISLSIPRPHSILNFCFTPWVIYSFKKKIYSLSNRLATYRPICHSWVYAWIYLCWISGRTQSWWITHTLFSVITVSYGPHTPEAQVSRPFEAGEVSLCCSQGRLSWQVLEKEWRPEVIMLIACLSPALFSGFPLGGIEN